MKSQPASSHRLHESARAGNTVSPPAPEPGAAAREAAGVDASRCPLCGQANACAMEAAKASGLPAATCWCVGASFPTALMARVPETLRNRVCVCRACAAAGS